MTDYGPIVAPIVVRPLFLVLSVGLFAVLPVVFSAQAQPALPNSPALRPSAEGLPSIGVRVALPIEPVDSRVRRRSVLPPTETRRDRIVLGTAFLTGGAAALTGSVVGGIGAVHLFQDGNELSTSLGLVLAGGTLALAGTGVWLVVHGVRIVRGQPQPLPPGYDRASRFPSHLASGVALGRVAFALR